MAMAVDRRNGSVWWMNASFVVLTAVSLVLTFQGARGAGIGIGIGLGLGAAGLQFDFYFPTCPNLEDICMELMQDAIDEDVGNAAGMIRLWFHECIVSGCDGSVLMDPIPGQPPTEKQARPNGSLKGFDIVDRAKARILDECPAAEVSCTDITLLLTRNAVFLAGGPFWDVTLGRRDGTTSLASQTSNLPAPTDSLKVIKDKFAVWGLTQTDVVVLSGAHTLGFAHCFVIQNRLYSSNGSAITDPTMSKSMARNLRKRCPQPFYNRVRPEAGSLLDLSSPDEFDNRYFSNLQQSSGVLSSDQLLYTGSSTTKRLVDQLASSQVVFFDNFVNSMIKLSKAGVLTGTQGEVRLNCRRPNAQQSTPASPTPPAVTSSGDPPPDLAAAAPPV